MSDFRPNFSRVVRRALFPAAPLLMLVLSGCALPHDTSRGQEWGRTRLTNEDIGGDVRRCTEAFAVIDSAIERAGTGDAQAAPVPGFPYLRTTRFLAAMGSRIEADDGPAFDYWVGWLAQTATRERGFELANLPKPVRVALHNRLGNSAKAVIEDCTVTLRNYDRRHKETNDILTATVNVPDNYVDMQRVIGIYPLSAIPVLIGFNKWKEWNLPSFSQPPSDLKMRGTPINYAPPPTTFLKSSEDVAALLRQAANNPLNIPRPTDDELRQLAAAFAPIFALDVVDDYDHIGKPMIVADGSPTLDTGSPLVYVQSAWTLFDGVPMLQIAYQIWFPERPATGGMDILSGRFDGLIWRVTLAPNGHPLLYDSIHPCGCYHLFFPVPPTVLKDHPLDNPGEGTTVPIDAPVLGPDQRMVLHIGSGDHYLRGLSITNTDTFNATRYKFSAMDGLRSLSLPSGGARSLYDPKGIVRGTERGERFLLWPMGIPNPGAMRQWGTHATAFVGRRHFDDPYLFDKAFRR